MGVKKLNFETVGELKSPIVFSFSFSMSYEQVLGIVGNNIPDIEKTEFYSTIAMVNRASWLASIQFTDQVLQYLSSADRTLEITKIHETPTKAIMHRRLNPEHNVQNCSFIDTIGIYKVDLLHGILTLIKIYKTHIVE